MNKLEKLGLKEKTLNIFNEKYSNYHIGRVILEHRNIYKISTESGEIYGEVRGKMKYENALKSDYPAVGDWVVLDRNSDKNGNAIILDILPRISVMKRKAAGGKLDEQIIASNMDVAFICMSLNNDFNVKRLDRYMVTAWDSGAIPVIILTKADLCDDLEERLEAIEEKWAGIDILVTSSLNNEGKEEIEKYIQNNKTAIFVGSSGVGKSSLLNMIIGEKIQAVKEIGEHDKGRHTTTHRELFVLENGGIIIDTPGMRELQIGDTIESVDSVFEDIEGLISKCKFSDCTHKREPGCAIKEAVRNGTLTWERYNSYEKLKKEALRLERKMNTVKVKKDLKKFYEKKEKEFFKNLS